MKFFKCTSLIMGILLFFSCASLELVGIKQKPKPGVYKYQEQTIFNMQTGHSHSKEVWGNLYLEKNSIFIYYFHDATFRYTIINHGRYHFTKTQLILEFMGKADKKEYLIYDWYLFNDDTLYLTKDYFDDTGIIVSKDIKLRYKLKRQK